MYPAKPVVECSYQEVSQYDVYDTVTRTKLATLATDFNNSDSHRFVPGDVVCLWDSTSNIFRVFACPNAPAGNWCCTANPEDNFDTTFDLDGSNY